MRNILAKELKIKFVETLSSIDGFSYEDGNPFFIKIYDESYFIFLKNLSPAYFKNSPDVTRVQLPYSEHFDKVFNANIPFVILGYDVDNDSLVCWNPSKIKDRLNARSNVSLYSRNSLQNVTIKHEFKTGFLSNREKIIIFRRDDLQLFFKKLDILFNDNHNIVSDNIDYISEPTETYFSDKLYQITDIKLLNLLDPLLEKDRVLEAVEICLKYYSNNFEKMTFKDWFNLVEKLYNNKKK